MTKLEDFVASLPSRETTELLELLFQGSTSRQSLYSLVTSDVDNSLRALEVMRESKGAIRAEINSRIPTRVP